MLLTKRQVAEACPKLDVRLAVENPCATPWLWAPNARVAACANYKRQMTQSRGLGQAHPPHPDARCSDPSIRGTSAEIHCSVYGHPSAWGPSDNCDFTRARITNIKRAWLAAGGRGLGQFEALIGGAIQAVGAVGSAAITADAAKSISDDQRKAALAKTFAAQNLALSQEEKAAATEQLQLEIGAQRLFEQKVAQQAGVSQAGQAVVVILVAGGALALLTLTLRKR